jgi:hypothetical protein
MKILAIYYIGYNKKNCVQKTLGIGPKILCITFAV